MICNYKGITKNIFLSLFVITIDFFLFSPVQALTFQTPIIEGQLVYGQAAPGEQINLIPVSVNHTQPVDPIPVPIAPDGRFVIGIPQDSRHLILEVQVDNQRISHTFPVQKRVWREEVVNGLPSHKVTPSSREQERITAESLLMRRKRQVSDFKTFPDKWSRPVPAFKRISSTFGSRRLLNGIKTQGHSGTDYAAPIGTSVIAPASGVVTLTHPDMFYSGKTVLIDHGYGVFSSYSHLNEITVRENQHVKPGDKIGEIGMTGRATGPHLHFTVTWFDIRVDPESLFQITKE